MFARRMELSDAEAAGDFSSSSDLLRCSLFYQAFPNALNVGRSGWRVEQWSEAIRGEDAVLTKASRSGIHRYIVVEIGANNIHNTDPQTLVSLIVEMLNLLRGLFPHARILLLAVFPRPIGRHFLAERIEETNQLLRTRFASDGTSTEDSSVRFFNINRCFYCGKEVDPSAFYSDRLHLNCHGYYLLESAIKNIIREALT